MNRLESTLWVLLTPLVLSACSGTYWKRSLYDGMRQGSENAARQPGARAVPQTTPLPSHDAYERERQRLRGGGSEPVADANAAAASAAAR